METPGSGCQPPSQDCQASTCSHQYRLFPLSPHLAGAVLVGALLRVAPQHPAGLPHLQPSSDHRRTRCPHLAAHHPVPVAVHVEEVLALLAAQHHEAVAGCAVLLHVDHQPELAQELSTQSLT